MKKNKILILNLLLIGVGTFGCQSNQESNSSQSAVPSLTTTATAKAYRVSHSDYICEATVGVNEEGLISEITIEEAFLPSTWAKVNNGNEHEEDVLILNQTETSATYYAKEIVIHGETYTASLRSDDDPVLKDYPNQLVKYSSDNISDLYTFVSESEDNAKWYYEAVKDGKVYFSSTELKSAGYLDKDDNIIFFKSQSPYWEMPSPALGWKGNIENMIRSLIGKKPTYEFMQSDDGYWVSGDINTQATLVSFNDYYNTIKMAYQKVVKTEA